VLAAAAPPGFPVTTRAGPLLNLHFPREIVRSGEVTVDLEFEGLHATSVFTLSHYTQHPPELLINSTHLVSRIANGAGDVSSKRGRQKTYATLLYNDDYLAGVLVLAESLRRVEALHGLIVITPPRTSPGTGSKKSNEHDHLAISWDAVAQLAAAGVAVVKVPWIVDLPVCDHLPMLGKG
jgi:hypothetical protein